ncbi:hypothetical protein CA984_39405 [Streptosporangium minutum]|uniref:Uncharacterized protein n=1 Tax=Streptosporangium minutum TaxID=569862 RepID=A0A243QUY1_9ACTN|nr:hypothetical protein CA984_39405 [Streptosporangium minutum]
MARAARDAGRGRRPAARHRVGGLPAHLPGCRPAGPGPPPARPPRPHGGRHGEPGADGGAQRLDRRDRERGVLPERHVHDARGGDGPGRRHLGGGPGRAAHRAAHGAARPARPRRARTLGPVSWISGVAH